MEKLTLIEKMDLYKKITEEIYSLIEDNYNVVEVKLAERQKIIESIPKEYEKEAQKLYLSLKLNELDIQVRDKIALNLDAVKEELKEYRKTKMVNSAYYRNSREKLNIFSKKV